MGIPRYWRAAFAVAASIGLLSGALAGPAGAQDARSGGVLNVGTSTEPTTLDPLLEQLLTSILVIENMYDTLIEYDQNLDFVPALAKSFTVADDSMSITFDLRDDVTFHNGRTMTSADVKWSLEKQREEDNVHKNLYSLFGEISTPDDSTLVVELNDATPSVALSVLAFAPSYVIAQEVFDEVGDLKRVDAGTGPFFLDSWDAGSRITLSRFEDYWNDPLPYLDQVVFKILPDETSAVAALRADEIDWFQFQDAVVASEVDGVEGLVYTQAPFLSYNYIGFNTTQEPFDDLNARLAVSYAMNRNDLLEFALDGLGAETGPIVPAQASLALDLSEYPSYTQNVETARGLLADAGYPDGVDVDLVIINTNSVMQAAAPVVVDQLAEIGINATIVPLDSGIWFEQLDGKTYNGLIMGQSGGAPNPDIPLFNSFSCDGSWNYSGICDPEYDELVGIARRAVGDERAAAYGDVQRRLVNDMMPYAYMFVRDQLYGWSDNVEGYVVLPLVERRFETVSLAE